MAKKPDNAFGRPRIYIDRHSQIHHLRSGFEVVMAFHLDCLKFEWEYETTFFEYKEDGETKKYLPDFYVRDLKLYIEVTGILEPKRKQLKVGAITSMGKNVIEVKEDYLNKLPLFGDSRDEFNYAAEFDKADIAYQLSLFKERVSNFPF